MIKTVIIDDEINSRELLYNMLTNFCEDIEIIGTAKVNVDYKSIATGQPIFGIDAKPKGMLTASIVKCPVFGGTIKTINSAATLAIAGVDWALARTG